MVQSPSWEANWFAASQEIPRISRNQKVHYRTHKRPPSVSILGQPNPVHIPTSHLLEIHSNIIYPSTPRSPQWSLSLRFPRQDPIQFLSPEQASRTWMFRNISVLQGGVVSTSSNPNLEDHPLSAVRDCLFNLFAATLHRRPFLYPQHEDAPCRGDRDPLHGNVTTRDRNLCMSHSEVWRHCTDFCATGSRSLQIVHSEMHGHQPLKYGQLMCCSTRSKTSLSQFSRTWRPLNYCCEEVPHSPTSYWITLRPKRPKYQQTRWLTLSALQQTLACISRTGSLGKATALEHRTGNASRPFRAEWCRTMGSGRSS